MIRALILIALGALVLAVAWKGERSGELPAGSRLCGAAFRAWRCVRRNSIRPAPTVADRLHPFSG